MIDKVANKGGLKGAGEAFTRRVAGGKTSRRRRRRDGASLSRNFLSSSSLSLHPLRGRPSLHFLALLLLASSDVLSVNAYEALLWLKSKAGTSGRLAGGRGRERILFFFAPAPLKGVYLSPLSFRFPSSSTFRTLRRASFRHARSLITTRSEHRKNETMT